MTNTAYAVMPAQPQVTITQWNNTPAFNKDLFTSFIEYIDRKDTTVKGYITCIKRFALWLSDNEITQPTREDIKAYRDFLSNSDFAVGTQSQYLRAVKQFFKWTASESLYPNVADNIHGAKIRTDIHKKDALQRDAVAAISNSIDRSTEQGRRLYAMFMLCVMNGLRTVELHRANVGDIKIIDNTPWLFVQGKGHDDKDAKCVLIPEVKKAIDEYLETRTTKPTAKSPLFTSTSNRSKDGRIAITTISTMLKEALKNAGYDSDRLTAHSLRHTSGTGAHKAGIDLYGVQHLMRHQNPATSEIYIHDDEQTEAELKGRQAIYDYYFNNKTVTPVIPELEAEIKSMSIEEQQKLLALIIAQKGKKNE